MNFNLPDSVAILSRTPSTLNSMLRGLPDSWTRSNEGPNTWSPFDVVGHLIHGDLTDWIPRARMILEHGESKTFVPYDRFAQEKNSQGKTLSQLLDEFARLRAENLRTLESFHLQPADFSRRGVHPQLGVVTLSELLATWTVHDLTHLHQISRTLAHQYFDAVGPWQKFLGVLRCSAHSD